MPKLRINSFKSDPTGWIGSGVMLAFAAIAAWRWSHSGLIFFALTGLRDLLAAWFLLNRTPALNGERNHTRSTLAYASSALPLMYLTPTTNTSSFIGIWATLFAIAGYALATLALIDLGTSFGISPINRGRIQTGLYRYLDHPMYIGYLVAELGFVFLNPLNSWIFITSSVLYLKRAKLETRLIALT